MPTLHLGARFRFKNLKRVNARYKWARKCSHRAVDGRFGGFVLLARDQGVLPVSISCWQSQKVGFSGLHAKIVNAYSMGWYVITSRLTLQSMDRRI